MEEHGGAYALALVSPFSMAQVAICVREVKFNLDRMLLTWVSMVRCLLKITQRFVHLTTPAV